MIMFSLKAVEKFPKKKSCTPKTTGEKLCKGPGRDGKTIVLSTIHFFFLFFVYVKEILAQVFTR